MYKDQVYCTSHIPLSITNGCNNIKIYSIKTFSVYKWLLETSFNVHSVIVLQEYSRNATFGGLMYRISTSPVPCWHDVNIVYTESTKYQLSIVASTVNVTVRANNSVGVSPETHITIPAQYLDSKHHRASAFQNVPCVLVTLSKKIKPVISSTACPENRSKTTTNNRKRMELCVVWDRLTGETPKLADENHSTVKHTTQAFKIMNAGENISWISRTSAFWGAMMPHIFQRLIKWLIIIHWKSMHSFFLSNRTALPFLDSDL